MLLCVCAPAPLGVYIPICLQSDSPHAGEDPLKAAHYVKCDSCITDVVPSGGCKHVGAAHLVSTSRCPPLVLGLRLKLHICVLRKKKEEEKPYNAASVAVHKC